MPRANRHYIPGYVWHITHRCHKKEFLLKFIEVTLKRVGVKAKRRKIVGGKKSYDLREPAIPYRANFTPENSLLSLKTPIFGTILYKYQQDSLVRPQAASGLFAFVDRALMNALRGDDR